MYAIGEKIIYGAMGVSVIQDIRLPDIEGSSNLCYLLEPLYFPGTKVFAPVENNPVTMRRLMSLEETQDFIDGMPEINVLESVEKWEDFKTYKNIIRSTDQLMLARLIKTLHLKRQTMQQINKSLPNNEKELLDSAKVMLHGEMAQSLQISLEQVVPYIVRRIEALGQSAKLVQYPS